MRSSQDSLVAKVSTGPHKESDMLWLVATDSEVFSRIQKGGADYSVATIVVNYNIFCTCITGKKFLFFIIF